MANVLIRNIDDAVIAQIDADALRLGLSRNEYLRRALERLGHEHARRASTSNGSPRLSRSSGTRTYDSRRGTRRSVADRHLGRVSPRHRAP